MITARGHRWQALDASTRRLGPFHVREDRGAGDKRVWLEDEDGRPGLGDHRLEDLIYASSLPLPRTVVITEGEKAANAVRAASLVAVGTVCGAAGTPGYAVVDAFLGVHVTLWPDHDAAGVDHMARFAKLLEPVVASMALVDWPDAPIGGDAADLPPDRIRVLVNAAHDIWLRHDR